MPQSIELVIKHTFQAPRELIFQAFTQAEHLKHWWGPKDWTLNVVTLDLQPGGLFHYSLESVEGYTMWGKFVYNEVQEPEKVVYTSSFSDEEGRTVRAPFSETWPLEILNTLTFTEQDGVTTLTMRGEPAAKATKKERQTYQSMHESMNGGFAETFNKLEEYLASRG